MTLSTDIIDRLARSLKPFWSYTQNDVIGDAMAEITNLRAEKEDLLNAAEHFRAERDAAARDMRERCAKVADEKAQEFRSPEYATNQPFSSMQERFACGEVAKAIRALPDTPAVIATSGKDAT